MSEISRLRGEVKRLEKCCEDVYNSSILEGSRMFIIAGKSEGFNFKDADIIDAGTDYVKASDLVSSLVRERKYKVAILTSQIERVDFTNYY